MPEGEEKEEYENYGTLILTTSIIVVVIAAPIGGILTKTLSWKLLPRDVGDGGYKSEA